MRFVRRFLLLLIVILALWWFWSLSRVRELPTPSIQAQSVQGEVAIQSGSSTEWRVLREGQVLSANDRIRTGASSTVMVDWFGRGQSVLDERTQVSLGSSMFDGTNLQVHASVNDGRVWTRVLPMLDLTSLLSFETLRYRLMTVGGSFVLSGSNGMMHLSVIRGAVGVVGIDRAGETMVADGQLVDLGNGISSTSTSPLMSDQDAWSKQQFADDQMFFSDARARFASLDQLVKPPLGVVGEVFQRAALRVRVIVQSRYRFAVSRSLFVRSTLAIRDAFDRGLEGDALSKAYNLGEVIRHHDQATSLDRYIDHDQLRVLMEQALPMFDSSSTSATMLQVQQGLQDVLIGLADTPAQQHFIRLFTMSEQEDEAFLAVAGRSGSNASAFSGLLHVALENERRGLASATVSDQDGARLQSLLKGLEARLNALDQAIHQLPLIASSSSSQTASSFVLTGVPTSTEVVTMRCDDLQIRSTTSSVDLQKSLVLHAFANVNGVSKEVTASSTWEWPVGWQASQPGLARASQVGAGLVNVSFGCGDQTLTANQMVTAQASVAATITGLSVVLSPASIPFSATSRLSVLAKYSDGSSKDVTAESHVSLSDPRIVRVDGASITAYQISGSIVVAAEYVSQGKTWTAEGNLTIVNPDVR